MIKTTRGRALVLTAAVAFLTHLTQTAGSKVSDIRDVNGLEERALTIAKHRVLSLNTVIRINQKKRPSENIHVPLTALTEEEQKLIRRHYLELF